MVVDQRPVEGCYHGVEDYANSVEKMVVGYLV